MNIKRNIKALRQICFIMDIVNLVLGIGIILLGIVILTDVSAHVRLFPLVFLLALFMNSALTFKHYLNNNKSRFILMIPVCVVLLIITCIGFIAVWGN